MKAENKETIIDIPVEGVEELAHIYGSDEKGFKIYMRRGWIEQFGTLEETEEWIKRNRERILVYELLNLQTEVRTALDEIKKLKENE